MVEKNTPRVCPECGKPFKTYQGLCAHRISIHGFITAKKSPKAVPKKYQPKVEKIPEILWDSFADREITPCPQCRQPRRAIKVNDEGTTLQCYLNWQCPLFMRPLDNARRAIVIPVVVKTREEIEEPEAVNG